MSAEPQKELAGLFVSVSTEERGLDCVAVRMLPLMHLQITDDPRTLRDLERLSDVEGKS